MTITDRQRDARASGIGSSDAAAILGLNPWRTAADVRLEKLGMLAEEPQSELAEIGTALEDGVATLAAKRLGVRLVKPKATYRLEGTPLIANVDRQIERAARGQPVVECKDAGLDDHWGEPGTDAVPAYVLCQVAHQMLVSEAPEAHVARLGRGFNRGLYLYRIAVTDDVKRLMDTMLRLLPLWWQRHVIDRDPIPDDQPPPNIDVLRRIIREPASVVPLQPELVKAWREADAVAKAAEKVAEDAKARVIAALGPAESGVCELGTVTFLEQSRAAYTVPAKTYRVCRFKEAKQLPQEVQ